MRIDNGMSGIRLSFETDMASLALLVRLYAFLLVFEDWVLTYGRSYGCHCSCFYIHHDETLRYTRQSPPR